MAEHNTLVSTEWVAEHVDQPGVVIADVDEDLTAYGKGHIAGSVGFDWAADFRHPVRRTFLERDGFEELMRAKGIANDDHVVLYGGNNNWFAAYAYWYFKVYGHDQVSLMDGGRRKWEAEGRDLTTEEPQRSPSGYTAREADESIRARRDRILSDFVGVDGVVLIDVRSPEEFSGKTIAPPHLPQEAAQVAGHIPGAANVPWGKAVNTETGEFRPVDELRALYADVGADGDKEIATYCRIGERSAHTWFVLHELLGYERTRNYDGSWTEYGSLVDVPVEL